MICGFDIKYLNYIWLPTNLVHFTARTPGANKILSAILLSTDMRTQLLTQGRHHTNAHLSFSSFSTASVDLVSSPKFLTFPFPPPHLSPPPPLLVFTFLLLIFSKMCFIMNLQSFLIFIAEFVLSRSIRKYFLSIFVLYFLYVFLLNFCFSKILLSIQGMFK